MRHWGFSPNLPGGCKGPAPTPMPQVGPGPKATGLMDVPLRTGPDDPASPRLRSSTVKATPQVPKPRRPGRPPQKPTQTSAGERSPSPVMDPLNRK